MAEATRSGLKSRVRENRTPGSVRGRLGNWPSYRDARLTLTHTSLPPLHSPENNHVASVPSHSNTRLAHPKAAIRIPSSAGPTHPMVSVPSFMIASRLLNALLDLVRFARQERLSSNVQTKKGKS